MTATKTPPPRIEEPVDARLALYEALGSGARLWDNVSIADRLLAKGFVIRQLLQASAQAQAAPSGNASEGSRKP